METALARLDDASFATIHALLSVPAMIRGFGPVKEDAMVKAAAERARLIGELDRPVEPERLPEAAE